jgi:hypothetical protein
MMLFNIEAINSIQLMDLNSIRCYYSTWKQSIQVKGLNPIGIACNVIRMEFNFHKINFNFSHPIDCH